MINKSRVVTALSALLLLLSACAGAEPEATATPVPTPTPAEYLEMAAQAMSEISTVQFSLTREGTPLVLDSSLGAMFVSGTGSYEAPDKVHASVKADISGNIVALDFLWLPEGVYMTNPLTGQYIQQPLELPLNPAALFDSEEGLAELLVTRIEEPVVLGLEQLEGMDAIHMSGSTDAETVTVIAPIEISGEFDLDLWLDASTSQVLRIQITEDNGAVTTLDFLGYGDHVEIPSPG